MTAAGVDPVAIDVFAHYYRLVERGETGMVPEDTIEPLDMESLADVDVGDEVAAEALAAHRGDQAQRRARHLDGAWTAPSRCCGCAAGLTFLDIIARQVLHLREKYDARCR